MKKFLVFLFLLCLTLSPSYGHEHGGAHSMHGGKDMELGKEVLNTKKKGISVSVYVNDIESAMKSMMKGSDIKIDMSKMDPNLTHHVAVNIKSDVKVKNATLKLTLKDKSKDYTLMSMHGHYGSDVSMKEKGKYKAILVVETEKGEKVKFTFNIVNK